MLAERKPHLLGLFRSRSFILADPETDNISGALTEIEPATPWLQAPTDFILDLSGTHIRNWITQDPATNLLHGSYLCQDKDVLLFAQNSTLDADGTWACEAHAFRTQFMKAFSNASYQALYPGLKPTLKQSDGVWHLSIDNLDDDDVIHINEPVFLATPLEPDNWGRWIATVVPKAVLFLQQKYNRKFFCRMKHPWQRAVLNELGLSDEVLLDHNPGRTYFCDDLMTIRHLGLSITVSNQERNMYAAIAKAATGSRRGGLAQERIFVSRLSLSQKQPRYRVLVNEAEVIEAMRLRGFTIVEPQNFSFMEQVAIFAEARIVVGLGGAAMYNVVFCSPGTKVVTIESTDLFIRPHSRLFASMGHRYGVVFGKEDVTDSAIAHRNWYLDVPSTLESIDKFINAT